MRMLLAYFISGCINFDTKTSKPYKPFQLRNSWHYNFRTIYPFTQITSDSDEHRHQNRQKPDNIRIPSPLTFHNNSMKYWSILRYMVHFQGKQLCHFIFASLFNRGLPLKERICSPRSKFFLFKSRPLLRMVLSSGGANRKS